MSSLAVPRPLVNANRSPRPRKPLLPASVTARFVGGATRQDVLDGAAVLAITTGDDTDRDEQAYWCLALFSPDGQKCVGFRLTKFGTGEVYDLPRDLSGCDCPDRNFRPERPGGCRHMVALRQALPTVRNTAAVASLARPIVTRRVERDEATMPAVAEPAK